jgi:hypothetical protein
VRHRRAVAQFGFLLPVAVDLTEAEPAVLAEQIDQPKAASHPVIADIRSHFVKFFIKNCPKDSHFFDEMKKNCVYFAFF